MTCPHCHAPMLTEQAHLHRCTSPQAERKMKTTFGCPGPIHCPQCICDRSNGLLDDLASLESQLSAARVEIERCGGAWLVSAPHDKPADCPSFFDGCNCTVQALAHNVNRADLAERRLEIAKTALREAENRQNDGRLAEKTLAEIEAMK